ATEGPPKVKVYGKGKGKGIDHRATVGAAEAASSALALVGAASAASFLPRGAKCLSTRRTPAKTKPAPHGAGFVPSATLQLQSRLYAIGTSPTACTGCPLLIAGRNVQCCST